MKFVQLIEYDMTNIFLQISRRKWGVEETSSRCLFVFLKRFMWGQSKWSAAQFQYILIALNRAYNKKNYKTLDYWSKDLLNFAFLQKGLAIVSPSHFVYDFSRKMFL